MVLNITWLLVEFAITVTYMMSDDPRYIRGKCTSMTAIHITSALQQKH